MALPRPVTGDGDVWHPLIAVGGSQLFTSYQLGVFCQLEKGVKSGVNLL
jgi:hypothetical protein